MNATPFLPGYRRTKLRRVTIEVTTWCNLKCQGCMRTILTERGQWADRHMSKELFARVVGNLPEATLGMLLGIGEPTLNPDYVDLCRIAKASGKFDTIFTHSNGLARDPEHYVELMEAGLGGFYISIDSLTPEIAALTRAGTRTDKLVERLRRMRELGLPVAVAMVVSRTNLHDAATTLRRFAELGVTMVSIGKLIGWEGGLDALDEDGCRTLTEIVEGVRRDCPQMPLSYADGAERIAPHCVAPWIDPAVNVDGYLTPCCVSFDPDTLGRINLGETSFAEAWDGPSVQTFLERYVTEKPSFCRGCVADNRP